MVVRSYPLSHVSNTHRHSEIVEKEEHHCLSHPLQRTLSVQRVNILCETITSWLLKSLKCKSGFKMEVSTGRRILSNYAKLFFPASLPAMELIERLKWVQDALNEKDIIAIWARNRSSVDRWTQLPPGYDVVWQRLKHERLKMPSMQIDRHLG